MKKHDDDDDDEDQWSQEEEGIKRMWKQEIQKDGSSERKSESRKVGKI